jgi:predicted permease
VRFERWLRTIPLRLRALVRGRDMDRELDEELRDYVERATAQHAANGLAPDAARRAALIALGGFEQRKDACRDARRVQVVEHLGQDLRYGARMLRRSPGFTAAAVISLALGLGATTAIFTAVNALLLRALPVRDPGRLVILRGYNFPYPQFEKLRDRLQPIGEVAGSYLTDRFDRPPGGERRQVRVGLVTGNYFSMLGVPAAAGRMIASGDDRAGAPPVAVISDAYWRRALDGAPNAVGQSVQLGASSFLVVGIAAKAFTGDWLGRSTDLWVPYAAATLVMPEVPALARFPARVFARLSDGVTRDRAHAFAEPVYRRVLEEDLGPSSTPGQREQAARASIVLESAASGFSPQRGPLSESLAILFVVVALVLVIACANVGNLLLARASARRREIALRLALGAGASRLVRQLLTESLLLACLGGTAGLLCAQWATTFLAGIIAAGPAAMRSDVASPAFVAVALDLHPDARVFAFAFALCLVTGVLFGLVPALRVTKPDLVRGLGARDAGAGAFVGRLRVPRLLVVAQVALSLILLIGAGLFVRTLHALRSGDLGFDRDHLLLVWTDAAQSGHIGSGAVTFARDVRDRLSGVPGVVSASVSNGGILQGGDWGAPSELTRIEGHAPKTGLILRRVAVMPGFFGTVGMPLVAGRDFTEQDANAAPRVAVINETMARFFFGGENPVGKRYGGSNENGYPVEIIGVVADAKTGTPRDRTGVNYVPYQQYEGRLFRGPLSIAVHTAGDPSLAAPSIRDALRLFDPALPILKIDTIDQQIDDVLVQDRLVTSLSTGFGAIGALLACVGLFGLLAYAAALRTGEIGVRLALGATRASILRMMLGESLRLVLAGVAVGVPAAFALTRLLDARLFGISAADPLTMGAAVALMIGVGVLAGALPGRRASRVDPVVALRCE